MKAVQTGTEHTWINTCAHCCVHSQGEISFLPVCPFLSFLLRQSFASPHLIWSYLGVLSFPCPWITVQKTSCRNNPPVTVFTWGLKTSQVQCHSMGSFSGPFPLSLSFLGVEIQEIAHKPLVFPGRHRCWDESHGAFWYSESSHLPHLWLNVTFTVYMFGVSGNVFK